MNEGDKFFVDTNLLLYSIDADQPAKQLRASAWLEFLWPQRVVGISWQVLNEFYWNATRKLDLPAASAQSNVRLFAQWNPLGPDMTLVERAWFWCDTSQTSYWDGLIVAAAERLGCSILLTEDLQADRTYGTVRVVNPFKHAPPAIEQVH